MASFNLFGFTIARDQKPELRSQSIITPVNDDGASTISTTVGAYGGYYGTYVDIDASARSESEIISRYREISRYPDCDNAIEEIVSEAIAAVDDEAPVNVNLDSLQVSDKIKKQIRDEFNEIVNLLDFNDKAHDIFRRWYVDGRLYYQKMIDLKNPERGIKN